MQYLYSLLGQLGSATDEICQQGRSVVCRGGVCQQVSSCQVQGVGRGQLELKLFAVHIQDGGLQQAVLSCLIRGISQFKVEITELTYHTLAIIDAV